MATVRIVERALRENRIEISPSKEKSALEFDIRKTARTDTGTIYLAHVEPLYIEELDLVRD